jgi:hypothetical protein
MQRGRFVELHLASLEPRVLATMESVGYGAAALAAGRGYVETNIMLLSKLVITEGGAWKLRMHGEFDIVSVIPWSRFVLNKFIRDERIHVITIDDTRRGAVPSRAQARVMAREGKALEVVVNPILDKGGLAFLRELLNSMIHVDGLVVLISQGISDTRDVRNPRDVAALLGILAPGFRWELAMSQGAYAFISDVAYMRGICLE